MANLTIIESDVQVTQTGKELKKLTIMAEGKQYPYKNVTAWKDSAPDYDKLSPGYKLVADIAEKDSNTINPLSGKPYINRTLYPAKNPNGTQASTTPPLDVVSKINGRLNKLEEKVFGETQQEIDPEDIPF